MKAREAGMKMCSCTPVSAVAFSRASVQALIGQVRF